MVGSRKLAGREKSKCRKLAGRKMKSVKVYLYVSAPPEPTDMFVFPT